MPCNKKGWHLESTRHSLASRGITTGRSRRFSRRNSSSLSSVKNRYSSAENRKNLSGERLLQLLEAGIIDPSKLTEEEKEKVLIAQEESEKEGKKSWKKRVKHGGRTSFGLGSWYS